MTEYRERYLRIIRADRREKIKIKGAQTQQYEGRVYHSRMEARYAQELDLMKRAGEIIEWIPQHKVSLDVNGEHICNYIVDFRVVKADGSVELVEVKGFETEIFRLKRKLFEATYLHDNPQVSYVIIRR